MSNAQHTPGPWRQGTTTDSIISDHPVRQHADPDGLRYYGGYLIAESIAPQNRPLIAAAPDLLAACRALLASPVNGDCWCHAGRENCPTCLARSAVAKATGTAPDQLSDADLDAAIAAADARADAAQAERDRLGEIRNKRRAGRMLDNAGKPEGVTP